MSQEHINYERIAKAINFLQANFKRQPSLEEAAAQVHLSPFHFQKMFAEWAGVSPKQFLQFLHLNYAKAQLRQPQANLFDAALSAGLSGPSRLHDLFIKMEGMTPGAYKSGGAALSLNYSFAETPFGTVLIAATPKGICYLVFVEDAAVARQQLQHQFPAAELMERTDAHQEAALAIFRRNWTDLPQIKLHLRGTPFQLKVWAALLQIPSGQLTTYGDLAKAIGQPGAARAVGSAVGDNPVSYLIPCHRVIQASGALGGYAWGTTRKALMIGWEAAQSEQSF